MFVESRESGKPYLNSITDILTGDIALETEHLDRFRSLLGWYQFKKGAVEPESSLGRCYHLSSVLAAAGQQRHSFYQEVKCRKTTQNQGKWVLLEIRSKPWTPKGYASRLILRVQD